MRTLAIETASEACSVALFEGSKKIAHDHRVLGRGHAEELIPMIEALPQNGRSERILVSLGPGSFTGVRIGIAAARTLGFAWGAEVFGYPTLALVAARANAELGLAQHSAITVCMNGGHGEWFLADYIPERPDGAVRSLTPEGAVAAGAQNVIAGNRAKDFAALLAGERLALDLLPDAGAINLLAEAQLASDLSPIYGRGPDATPLKVSKA